MKKLSIYVLAALAVLLSFPLGKRAVDTIRAGGVSKEQTNPNAVETKVPVLSDILNIYDEPKTTTVKNVLTLEAKNTAVFRGPVTGQSVAKAMKEISKLSRNLSKTDKIYLVLDTPGGSIFDGLDFIDFLEGIPQEVKTVTIFAASMGFQIAENNPGERLITRQGTLMSHRATGGLDGQFNGEFEVRYRMVKRKIDYLDTVDAKRVGLSYDDYQKKVKDEWWVHGFDSVDAKVADKMVLLQCGSSMEGTDEQTFATPFGSFTVVFDKCPLLREPVAIKMDGILDYAKPYMKNVVHQMYYDKINFVKEVVLTNKFYSIFPAN